jgi:5-methylthioribose kinase
MLKLWGIFTTMFWAVRMQPRLEEAMKSGNTSALHQICKESVQRVLEKEIPGNIFDDFFRVWKTNRDQVYERLIAAFFRGAEKKQHLGDALDEIHKEATAIAQEEWARRTG